MQRFEKKHKNIEMMLNLTSFSMFKLMVPCFQHKHLFGIGHEKHPFGYVMDFEISKIYIMHSKEL
jgi:hypothetical protein